jgi:uncharacterized membrane protein
VEGGGPPVRESIEFARIVAFTDGVFAIAITLLVLSLEVPPDVDADALHDYLADSWPQLFAYFLSFAVIGRYWVANHSLFALLHDFDRGLLVLNLVYLALIVLIPFPTELLGEYGDTVDAVVAYAAVVGTASLLGWVLLRYALGHGLVRDRATAREMAPRMLHPVIVFYVSIPIAFLSPLLGKLLWLVLLLDHRPRR